MLSAWKSRRIVLREAGIRVESMMGPVKGRRDMDTAERGKTEVAEGRGSSPGRGGGLGARRRRQRRGRGDMVGRQEAGGGPCRERCRDGGIWGGGSSRGRRGARAIGDVEVNVELHIVWIKGEGHVHLGTGGVAIDEDDVDGLKVLEEGM